jgi:hypothetical protein
VARGRSDISHNCSASIDDLRIDGLGVPGDEDTSFRKMRQVVIRSQDNDRAGADSRAGNESSLHNRRLIRYHQFRRFILDMNSGHRPRL